MNLKFSTFITMYGHFFPSTDFVKLESQVIYERSVTENELRLGQGIGQINKIQMALELRN